MVAATFIKKIPAGLVAMFLVTLILCQGFANAKDKQPTEQVMDIKRSHIGKYSPGIPLYRSRSDPNVFIPEYRVMGYYRTRENPNVAIPVYKSYSFNEGSQP
ncbi:hypothetical protein CRYUN_Cryun05aG0172200 [Craigia yunnanensis]